MDNENDINITTISIGWTNDNGVCALVIRRVDDDDGQQAVSSRATAVAFGPYD